MAELETELEMSPSFPRAPMSNNPQDDTADSVEEVYDRDSEVRRELCEEGVRNASEIERQMWLLSRRSEVEVLIEKALRCWVSAAREVSGEFQAQLREWIGTVMSWQLVPPLEHRPEGVEMAKWLQPEDFGSGDEVEAKSPMQVAPEDPGEESDEPLPSPGQKRSRQVFESSEEDLSSDDAIPATPSKPMGRKSLPRAGMPTLAQVHYPGLGGMGPEKTGGRLKKQKEVSLLVT